MRYARKFALIALSSTLVSANAQDLAPGASCPVAIMAAPIRFGRLHQIPTTAPRDDISHKMVTPGGLVFDTPKMVAATDVLSIVARTPNALCFSLRTFARDRHTCELSGVADKQSGMEYLFSDDTAVVRLTFIAEDQVRVEPVGAGYRTRCQASGKIEPAIYTLSEGSN
jgi:hypothetical protein